MARRPRGRAGITHDGAGGAERTGRPDWSAAPWRARRSAGRCRLLRRDPDRWDRRAAPPQAAAHPPLRRRRLCHAHVGRRRARGPHHAGSGAGCRRRPRWAREPAGCGIRLRSGPRWIGQGEPRIGAMSSGIPLPRGESADRRFSSDPVEETSAIRYFLGVDVGGTFTDVVVGDTDGHVATVKVPTTPDDPREGVAAGVAEILRAQGVGPRRVSRVVHGTTLAANVILERKGSDVAFVTTEGWPEVREYERAMTTVMCAYVGPVMNRYLAGLQDQLAAIGLRCPIEVMESSGGVMSASLASRRPVYTIESGGAAGVMAAAFVGRLIDANEVVSFDMGGTTAKTGIVRQGRPDVTHDCHVGGVSTAGNRRAGSGYPVKIPVVDLAEVGAGGGSIASVDSGGALRVGPESSGSVPGPACYGRGGAAATVTDANLLLGYLRPGKLEAGVSLSEELAAQAVRQHVAAPLSLPVPAAARAIHDVANATMASAIRVVTVQRGIDPRRFTLVAFGGAGPMHAVELAEMFGIDEVAVPRGAGVAAALGLITSDLVVERARTWVMPLASAVP